jgi:hypothetical protein
MRIICTIGLVLLAPAGSAAGDHVDFNRDVRPILSGKCLLCHGPDEESRQAGLRLDQRAGTVIQLDSGSVAVVPGDVDGSEMIARIHSNDDDLRMPPVDAGARLSAEEIDVLKRWIKQGAEYSKHWSYVAPQKPGVPEVPSEFSGWPQNPIDHFALRKMLQHGLHPAERADRYALVRRIFLDLTGLPPTIDEADAFAESQDAMAYEQLVDDLLQSDSFGEHWARKWLDLARYADSAGYADDPSRTIWAWRDWVIRAINSNMPFDQFTIEQLAGDLLPNATDDQIIATAFHRNTMTNSEGGTIDEEFRNVAIVDRVNTTFAVWMGTTMACAQCHTHKYDPITQDEYFRVFAILNNTQDADRRDETPLLQVYSKEQRNRQRELKEQIAKLRQTIGTTTPELVESQRRWEQSLGAAPQWQNLTPASVTRSSGEAASIQDDGTILVSTTADQDTYTVELPLPDTVGELAAIQLDTLPHKSLPGQGPGLSGGNFVITGVKAQVVPVTASAPEARYIRITNIGDGVFLSLAEVEVFRGTQNVARQGMARQVSTGFGGPAELAIDGNTDGEFTKKSTTHTAREKDPWWELDLGSTLAIDRVQIWNRTDNKLHVRLKDYRVELLDGARRVVWEKTVAEPPEPLADLIVSNARNVPFSGAVADYHQPKFEPSDVLTGKTSDDDGWAVGGKTGESHQLVVISDDVVKVDQPSVLRIMIEQNSAHKNHLLAHFRINVTSDENTVRRSRIPEGLLAVLDQPTDKRAKDDANRLAQYYRETIAQELAEQRQQLANATAELENLAPVTSVPVLREMTENRRETYLQFRGNWQSTGHKVNEGVPDVFHSLPDGQPPNRLALARWLVDDANPLTARVVVNRYWEALFGRGLVLTSEDFGTQGDLPTHPELLDWLATQMIRNGWDRKALLKQIVMSATYCQNARVNDEAIGRDPDNRWLARGPRVRLSAEMVRDQALFVSGLLTSRMYGAPVNPPQPSQGLRAAFGSSTDWKTSEGEDRYRRGIYTTWRRSNPYPSMATFDAPNREVCTVRRNRTNTPLQSLVTLNDPVYVEAAQSLARKALLHSESLNEQVSFAFRSCLLRPPTADETAALVTLFNDVHAQLVTDEYEALKLATDPLGPLPDGMNSVDAATMTVVGNVLLNLDEIFLKR